MIPLTSIYIGGALTLLVAVYEGSPIPNSSLTLRCPDGIDYFTDMEKCMYHFMPL